MKQDGAGGVSAASGQISQQFGVGRAQARFVPVVAADFVPFRDVEFALIKREPVRFRKTVDDDGGTLRLTSVFRIGQRDDTAFIGFAHQHNSSWTEDHHAGGVGLSEDREVKSVRNCEPA